MGWRIQPDRSVADAVVEAVSALQDRPPDSLPPIDDVLSEDLDELFAIEDPDRTLRLTFEYEGYYVTIENDATLSVEVEPKPEDPFAV